MTTERKTREQVMELLFQVKKDLHIELAQYRAMTEQLPAADIQMTPALEALKLISVKSTGQFTAFTGVSGALDIALIEAYLQKLSTSGETTMLLILSGCNEALGPDDVCEVCGKADYYTILQIDASSPQTHSVYLIGAFGKAYRSLYAPDTMFRIAAGARRAKREQRAGKRKAHADAVQRDSSEAAPSPAGRPSAPGNSIRIVPAPGFVFDFDEAEKFNRAI